MRDVFGSELTAGDVVLFAEWPSGWRDSRAVMTGGAHAPVLGVGTIARDYSRLPRRSARGGSWLFIATGQQGKLIRVGDGRRLYKLGGAGFPLPVLVEG